MKQWHLMAFTFLGAAALACGAAYTSVAGRWHSIGAITAMLSIYAAAGGMFLCLTVGSVFSKHRSGFVVSTVSFGLLFGCAASFSRHFAELRRSDEISKAIENGLEIDCKKVIATYRRDSRLEKEGYVRLFPGSKEFDSLPRSIREFQPVYLTIEANPFGTALPLNVGLCKNGFGGFHMGVRVFDTDPKIPASWDRQRISATIYLWIDET